MKHTKGNEMKHAPGPWKIGENISGSIDHKIFGIFANDETESNGPSSICTCNEADATLIAAAPELLKIAIAYRNLLKTMAHTDGEVTTFHHIESVIAKARGSHEL